MIDFYNGQITDILPGNLKETADVHALSYAVMRACQRLQSAADRTRIYADIDSLPEKILDVLAVELRTQFYDETFPIKTKQELIKNTLAWYSKAGTVAAVKEPLETIFGNGEIEEWFEYGGLPYHFRIVTRQGDISYEDKKRLMSVLETVKRKSTVLDYITLIFNETITSTNVLTGRVINRIRLSPFNKPVIALRDGQTKRNGLATRAGYENGIPYPFDTMVFNRLTLEETNSISIKPVINLVNKNIVISNLTGVRHKAFLTNNPDIRNRVINKMLLEATNSINTKLASYIINENIVDPGANRVQHTAFLANYTDIRNRLINKASLTSRHKSFIGTMNKTEISNSFNTEVEKIHNKVFLQNGNNLAGKIYNSLKLGNADTYKVGSAYFIWLNNNYHTRLNTRHFISFKPDNKISCNAVTKTELKNVNTVTSTVLTTNAPLRRNGRYKRDGTAYRDGNTAKYII